jgi:hypothetical protein
LQITFAGMSGKKRQILLHVAACLTFLLLPVLFAPDLPQSFNISRSIPTQRNLIAYLLMIAFFYFNLFFLIPKFYYTKKYFLFFLIIIFCFIIVSLLPAFIIPEGFGRRPLPPYSIRSDSFFNTQSGSISNVSPAALSKEPPPHGFPFYITQYFFIFLAVVFFSLILSINNRWKQTEKERLNAELSYLKAQVNPHFLFNTLNNIYSLALEKSDNTPAAIVKLSGMMRYVLNETENDFVTLDKEITYLTNYIELQKIRYSDSVKLSFIVNGNTVGKRIAPLILIPFVENALKYGVNAEEDSDIKITIDIKEKEFRLIIINNKVNIQQPVNDKTGLGIENAKNRLQLLYPARHELKINDAENFFYVSLNLELE